MTEQDLITHIRNEYGDAAAHAATIWTQCIIAKIYLRDVLKNPPDIMHEVLKTIFHTVVKRENLNAVIVKAIVTKGRLFEKHLLQINTLH